MESFSSFLLVGSIGLIGLVLVGIGIRGTIIDLETDGAVGCGGRVAGVGVGDCT